MSRHSAPRSDSIDAMISFRRKPNETYEQRRQRMIAETSVFLTMAMRRPELAVEIPVIVSGKGKFPRSMAESFWRRVLSEP